MKTKIEGAAKDHGLVTPSKNPNTWQGEHTQTSETNGWEVRSEAPPEKIPSAEELERKVHERFCQ